MYAHMILFLLQKALEDESPQKPAKVPRILNLKFKNASPPEVPVYQKTKPSPTLYEETYNEADEDIENLLGLDEVSSRKPTPLTKIYNRLEESPSPPIGNYLWFT